MHALRPRTSTSGFLPTDEDKRNSESIFRAFVGFDACSLVLLFACLLLMEKSKRSQFSCTCFVFVTEL